MQKRKRKYEKDSFKIHVCSFFVIIILPPPLSVVFIFLSELQPKKPRTSLFISPQEYVFAMKKNIFTIKANPFLQEYMNKSERRR